MTSGELEPSKTLVELARRDEPAPNLAPYLARFQNAGVTTLSVVQWPSRWPFEVVGGAAALGEPFAIAATGHDVVIWTTVEWDASRAPITRALDELADSLQRFDRIRRLRHGASDMRLVADAAAALVEARESDGPARLFDRVLETGMVVTYVRPFLESNKAGLGRSDWPKVDDRALHDELVGSRKSLLRSRRSRP